MKPNALYRFRQSETAKTRYLLTSHTGETVANFPAMYVRGENKGKQYVGYRATATAPKVGHRHFTHTIELAGNKTFTGVNFTETEPNKTYGDNKNSGRNDGLLIEYTNGGQELAIYFFFDQAENIKTLWEKWLANGLCMEVDPLVLEQEKSPTGGNL